MTEKHNIEDVTVAGGDFPATPIEIAALSIAISLKRIADALSRSEIGADHANVRDILVGIEMNLRGGP